MKLWYVVAGVVGLGAAWYLLRPSLPNGTSVSPNMTKPGPYAGGSHLRAVPPPKPVIATGPSTETRSGTGHF